MSARLWQGISLVLAALLVAAAFGIVYAHNAGNQAGFERATSKRAARDADAIVARVRDNAALSIEQDKTNQIITRTKNEELSPVVQRIYVDRVRVGAGTCGPAGATEAENAGSGNLAHSPARLVREDVERDTRTLTEAVELDLATGRACQAWGRENGFFP